MKKARIAFMTILLGSVGLTVILFSQEMNDLAQLVFSSQAKAATMERDGIIMGYKLVGHTFSYPGYFHGTASAVDAVGYDEQYLSKSGTGNASPNFNAQFNGLNPIISLDEAYAQIERVAKARGLNSEQVHAIVDTFITDRSRKIFSEEKVNVRELNIALDDMKRKYVSRPTNHNGRRGVR